MRTIERTAPLLALIALVAGCGSTRAHPAGPIGAGLRGPSGLRATVYARGLSHVSALTFDADGRLWATTSGSSTHATDGVYLVEGPGAKPVKIVGGLEAPLGLVWAGNRLIVSSLGRVTSYGGFDGRHFRTSRVIVDGPVAGGENNNVVLAPDGRLVMGVSASCDHCVPTSKWSGTIVTFRPDGSDLRILTSGVRAAYGLAYLPGTSTLFATMNQRDDLGVKTPGDWLAVVEAGQDWGFPSCYGQCAGKPGPAAVLDAHAAAGGAALVRDQFGADGPSALVAEWEVGIVQRVVLHRSDDGWSGTAEPFISGFQHPLAVLAAAPDVLVGDWGTGLVYRIADSQRSPNSETQRVASRKPPKSSGFVT